MSVVAWLVPGREELVACEDVVVMTNGGVMDPDSVAGLPVTLALLVLLGWLTPVMGDLVA